jgi:hypothetical protein
MAFPLTQEEIASTIGVSTVHANRVVQALRATGQIDFVTRRTLEILDLHGLREKAGFAHDARCQKTSVLAQPNAIGPNRTTSNVIPYPWRLTRDFRLNARDP